MSTTAEHTEQQSRLPKPEQFDSELIAISTAMAKSLRNDKIPRATVAMVQLRAGQIVGSSYHTVHKTGLLRKAGATEDCIAAVAAWRDAPYFTDAERVALELVEAVLTANPTGERVPDELFAKASAHYDVEAMWTLVMAIGQICYFIPVGLIARPITGRPIGKNYSD
ncbi:carboxymuconolactone decarboxylase family protein [Pseudonocardia sp. TRM90224]|uniref:carboxymuconolactone decarboxylase family protein n=1 Tax=Pseudonocardia sp. TRM90224 TaxID=2812678 RepID=UPI001E32A7B0|nr:carboxymuconolactone decarboxylase family protein [Pseudonocardia sp. TRM90224]